MGRQRQWNVITSRDSTRWLNANQEIFCAFTLIHSFSKSALENVLKGLIIANDAKLIASGKLDNSLKSHNLIDLAKRVNGLILSKDEKHILQVCQDAIPYWGRYPIPLEYKGLKPIEAVNDKFRACFRQLHYRLCKSLYDSQKDGWDSGVEPESFKMRSVRYGDTIDPKEKFPWVNDNNE